MALLICQELSSAKPFYKAYYHIMILCPPPLPQPNLVCHPQNLLGAFLLPPTQMPNPWAHSSQYLASPQAWASSSAGLDRTPPPLFSNTVFSSKKKVLVLYPGAEKKWGSGACRTVPRCYSLHLHTDAPGKRGRGRKRGRASGRIAWRRCGVGNGARRSYFRPHICAEASIRASSTTMRQWDFGGMPRLASVSFFHTYKQA